MPLQIELALVAPMAKLVDATDLNNLSGSCGNELLDPIKFGEPPKLKSFRQRRANPGGEPPGRCREWTVGTYGRWPMVEAHSRLQTRSRGGENRRGMKIRWPQGHAGSTPARGTKLGDFSSCALALQRQPLACRHAPDIDGFAAAAQFELR